MSDSCARTKIPKGLILRRVGWLDAQNAINEHYEKGYKVRSIYPNFESVSLEKGDQVWYVFLELDTGGYESVTNLKDVPPEEVDSHIIQGWEIASASISTKFVRMVKRKVDGE